VRRVAAVILNLLFMVCDLLLHMGHGSRERMHHINVFVAANELAIMFGGCDNLHFQFAIAFFVEIDRDLNHGQSVEEVEKFFSLLRELLLDGVVQLPVSGGDFHLHGKPRSLSSDENGRDGTVFINRVGAARFLEQSRSSNSLPVGIADLVGREFQ
jgi:hypothetical protein